MENIYWNNKGTYQAKSNELESLVPARGKCETLQGELFRAAMKVYHDFYNNGFGNNWKEPAAFLMKYIQFPSARVPRMLLDHASGNLYEGEFKGDNTQLAVEELMDFMSLHLNEIDPTLPTADMWDTETEGYNFVEEREFEW